MKKLIVFLLVSIIFGLGLVFSAVTIKSMPQQIIERSYAKGILYVVTDGTRCIAVFVNKTDATTYYTAKKKINTKTQIYSYYIEGNTTVIK